MYRDPSGSQIHVHSEWRRAIITDLTITWRHINISMTRKTWEEMRSIDKQMMEYAIPYPASTGTIPELDTTDRPIKGVATTDRKTRGARTSASISVDLSPSITPFVE